MSHVGTMSTSLAIGTLEDTKMLCTRVSSTIVLPDGVVTTENVAEKLVISALKGVVLNLAALPGEALHLLQME